MSFSMDVKEEISGIMSESRHCRLAELAAMLSCGGRIYVSNNRRMLRLQTENLVVARKYFTLIKKTFNINIDVSIKINYQYKKTRICNIIIRDTASIKRILQATKLADEDLINEEVLINRELGRANQLIVQKSCCKRAFIRGAFLSSGSISNPKKAYHLEIVTNTLEKAEQLQSIIQAFSIDAKIVSRKKNYVVYVKEGSQIVDFLNVMEAHVALMNLENVRILKEMRNSINRQVNCEAANINKTVTASSKQIEDIIYIRDSIGFGELAEGIEDVARLRAQHPDATLKELGEMLLPPIGKSGVNHRLRKLSMIADRLREHKEEESYDN